MYAPTTIVTRFGSPVAQHLGHALQHSCVTEYDGCFYWVVGATYHKRSDTITWKVKVEPFYQPTC